LQLWAEGRSTRALAGVQVADARSAVVKEYQGIAVLDIDEPSDLQRQRMLTSAMTGLVGDLGTALGVVRSMPGSPDPANIRQRLIDAADRLERDYR
jgi:hypothetical protein